MSIGITRGMGALAALVVLTIASPAASRPGSGIRLGGSEGRLHPFIELEQHYDSDVYITQQNEIVGDSIIHVRPGLEFEVPGELTSVDFIGNLDWAQYLGMQNDETVGKLSKLYGQAILGLVVNRRGPYALELTDEFRRSPSTSAFTIDRGIVANFNELALQAPFTPGGGALIVTPKFGWLLETFDAIIDDPTREFRDRGYNEFRPGGEVRWRFLPRTSAVFEAGYFSRIPNDKIVSEDVSGFEVQTGLTGLVTPHIGATVKLGYGDTLGSAGEDFRTWLATLEGQWIATEAASVRVGYGHGMGVDPGLAPGTVTRDGVDVSKKFSAYGRHRVYAGGRLLLAGKYSARIDAQFEQRSYGLVPGGADASFLRIEPSFEAPVSPWMVATVAYAYTSRDSSFATEVAAAETKASLDYSRNEVWLRVGFTY